MRRASSIRSATGIVLCVGAALTGCDSYFSPPEFGFRAYYELPVVRPNDRCGTDNGGPTDWPWVGGPHAGFGEFDPLELAHASLRWFEESPEAVIWRGNSSARLELDYASRGREVTARYDPEAGLSWEEQLRTWFACFPPEGEMFRDLGDEHYSSHVSFGERGTVRESTASGEEAVRGLKVLVASLPPSPLFEHPSFSLSYNVRRSSHAMDCYGSDDVGAELLDELPDRVREKVSRYARK